MKWYQKLSMLFAGMVLSSAYAASPWFTGPIVAPAGQTIPKGHFNFEPYFLYSDSYGVYNNNWKPVKVPSTQVYSVMPVISYGLTDYMDVQAVLPYNSNNKSSITSRGVGDLTMIIGVQAYKQKPGHWAPSLRVSSGVSFPTGRYNNVDPAYNGTDINGSGAYQATLGLNFQQVSQPFNDHYLRTRFALTGTFPFSTTVNNFNAYGGGNGTNGIINPGVQVQADLAFEYQLTQHWVPVFEVVYVDRQASNFRGTLGTVGGLPATVVHGEVEQLSIAPAIEYNINDHFGVIAGVWLSLTGKSSEEFITGAVAVNYFV